MPHPGEAEIHCGGLVAKLAARGQTVGILDLTAGEAGSHTYLDQKLDEANQAALRLGAAWRACVRLPDARLENTMMSRMTVTGEIKRTRPRLAIGMAASSLHPDHPAAETLLRDSIFAARLERLDDYLPPHNVDRLLFAVPEWGIAPDLLIDVTEHFPAKLEALAHYTTLGADAEALKDRIIARASALGELAGVRYAEGFRLARPLLLDLP